MAAKITRKELTGIVMAILHRDWKKFVENVKQEKIGLGTVLSHIVLLDVVEKPVEIWASVESSMDFMLLTRQKNRDVLDRHFVAVFTSKVTLKFIDSSQGRP